MVNVMSVLTALCDGYRSKLHQKERKPSLLHTNQFWWKNRLIWLWAPLTYHGWQMSSSSRTSLAAPTVYTGWGLIKWTWRNFLVATLRGQMFRWCVFQGVGWWKYEFCYGKHVHQYHEVRHAFARLKCVFWGRLLWFPQLKTHTIGELKSLKSVGAIVPCNWLATSQGHLLPLRTSNPENGRMIL